MSDIPEPTEALKDSIKESLGIDISDDDQKVELTGAQFREAVTGAYQTGLQFQQYHNMESSLLFWQLMESLPDHVFFKDRQSRFICINDALAKFFGIKHPDEAIGKSDFDFFQGEFASTKFDAEQDIMRTGEGWSFREEHDIKADGSEEWVVTTKLPLHDLNGEVCGTFGLSRNITEHKLAQIQIERQQYLLETIIQILPCRIFVRDAEGRFMLINEEYRKIFGLESREYAVGKKLTELRSNDKARRVEEEDRKIIEEGLPVQNRLEFDQSLLGEKCWVLSSKVPLRSREGKVDGIVGMTLDITEQKEAEQRAQTANEKLTKINKQFETELLVARQLQERLMSMGFDSQPLYTRSGDTWDLEASYLYSPSHHLAGDFFYLVPIAEDKMGILVCDVMGHGVKAALVTMLIRGLILEAPDFLTDPSKVLSHLNQALASLAEDSAFPRFVTAVYASIDLTKGEAKLASAGHPAPLFSTGEIDDRHFEPFKIGTVGAALGLIPEEVFQSETISLCEKTELLFFTDGIIEQASSKGEDFGAEKLGQAIISHESDQLPDQLDWLSGALAKFADTDSFDDDICIIAVRLTPKQS